MLAGFNVIVVNKAECVPVGFARIQVACRSGPRGCADLKDEPLSGVVPDKHAFGVAPGRTASADWVAVEVVVPNHVVGRFLGRVDLAERGTRRIVQGCADFVELLPRLQGLVCGAGVDVVQAELVFVLVVSGFLNSFLISPRAKCRPL